MQTIFGPDKVVAEVWFNLPLGKNGSKYARFEQAYANNGGCKLASQHDIMLEITEYIVQVGRDYERLNQ